MKNIFKLMLFTSLFFVSCDENLLEPFTPGALTEDVAIQKSSDLQKVMNAAYNQLLNREDAVFTSIFTDEAGIGHSNGGQGRSAEYIFFLTPDTAAPNSIWNSCYYSLSRANRVIKFADLIAPTSPADVQIIARLKAEALVIRAHCHLKLMSYFSPDPKNDGALAAVLADRIITASEVLPRSTNGDFYASIHSDLNAAIAIYATNTAPAYTAPTVYANKNLATALKARAYALKGDYTNAETWADQTIANGPTLVSVADYTKLFWSESEPANREVIFRLKKSPNQNGQGINLHNGWCSIRPNAAGSPFYDVSRALHNILNPNNYNTTTQLALFNSVTDVRLRTIVAPSSVIDPNYLTSTNYLNSDKLILHKHGGVATGTNTWANTGAGANNNDFKIARISEMYFIKAEARTAAGDLAGAAAVMDIVIDARNTVNQPTPVYANATAAWKGILDQRRLEFAFEGYRYIDLKRIGTLAGAGLDRHPVDYAQYPLGNPANLPLTSYKFTLPIPRVELDTNNGIQQNPGY